MPLFYVTPLPLMRLASVKSRLVLPFWYRLTRVVLDKGPLNGCVCVRVCYINCFSLIMLACFFVNMCTCRVYFTINLRTNLLGTHYFSLGVNVYSLVLILAVQLHPQT